MVKYTKAYLSKLEDIFAESDYHLRYEKGRFKSGYCVLKDTKVILVNNFYPLDGKINCLIEIIKTQTIDTSNFTEKTLKLYKDITQETESQQLEITL